MTEFSHMPYPLKHSNQESFSAMQGAHATQNPFCACPECDYYRSRNVSMTGPQPGMPVYSAQPAMCREPPRKYTHNPYALGAYPSQINSSSPPIVTAEDALASIVPNVADYDVYGNMSYLPSPPNMNYPPPPTQSHPVAANMGNAVLDQFNQVLGMIADVACTPRGRTMLQSTLRLRQPEQIRQISDEICANEVVIQRVMLDGNGCHVVRSLIDVMEPMYLRTLASPSVLSEANIIQLATSSQHSRRILQSIFERFSHEPFCDGIACVLARHAQYLATTQQGCIALMRVVDNAQPVSQRNVIHESLFPALVSLASDPYGNYVVQHTIERGDTALISNAVMNFFLSSTAQLCCNKFASNVMEKVLYNVNPGARRAVIESMISNPVTLQSIMNDGYGNFVIQAAIDSCINYQEYRRMADRMRALVHTSPYGHKIEAKLRSKRTSQSFHGSSGARSATSSACNTAPTTPRNAPQPYAMNYPKNWAPGA